MLIAMIISAGLLLALAVMHALCAKIFNVYIVNGKRPVNREFQPRATVIMSIRGCDPSLENNLIKLLQQDYQNYDIVAVIDHQSDAAWSRVHHIQSEFDTRHQLKIIELRQPLDSCSLKCSALLQAFDQLDPQTEIMVLMDADVTPHEQWLIQAVSPLADPKVGVVTGNQWFEPKDDSVGSLLRSIWNAGALVPTAMLANPWAGTCAMRVNDVVRAGLPQIWQQSIVDDGPIRRAMQPLGLHVVFNPELIMVNREKCTQAYVHRYVARILTWSRFYEKTYVTTFIHMLLLVGSSLATMFLALWALVQMQWGIVLIAAAAFVINAVLNFAGYQMVRSSIARIERRREHVLEPLPSNRIWNLVLMIPYCQLCYGVWTVKSALTRRVNWRQITYEVKAHDQVRMIRYRPHRIDAEAATSNVSL